MPALEDLPVQVIRARWFRVYREVRDLSRRYRHAQEIAKDSPYASDRLLAEKLKHDLDAATKHAVRLREALNSKKVGR